MYLKTAVFKPSSLLTKFFGISGFCFFLTCSLPAAPPEVARVQGQGDIITVWGVGFEGEAVEILGWSPPHDAKLALDFLKQEKGEPSSWLPETPPVDAMRLEILQQDKRGYVMAVEIPFGGRHNRPQVIWVRNADGVSEPFSISSAKPWMIYPQQARAGEVIRVFGRDLARGIAALRSADTGEIIVLESDSGRTVRNARYELALQLPGSLPVGDYALYVHNQQGGAGAWGGPLELTVREAEVDAEEQVLNVRDFGAVGNGVADDTDPIREALIQAGEAGGATVFLPPGRYAIRATLWIPEGVTLRGAGGDTSVLVVSERRPMHWDVPAEVAVEMPGHFRGRMVSGNQGAMLWMRDNSRVVDLGFEDGPGVMQAIYASHTGVEIIRCRMRMLHAPMAAIFVEWGSYGFTMRGNDIMGRGAVAMVHGPHIQSHIAYNTFRATEAGISNVFMARALERSLIEENIMEGGDRNFVTQMRPTSNYRSVVIGNRWSNNTPRRHNAGENMHEGGGIFWSGSVVDATADSVRFEGKPFEDAEYAPVQRAESPSAGISRFALVLDGRGLGQYLPILSHTEATLTLDGKWGIVPDASSYIAVVSANADILWIDNTEEMTSSWTGVYGVALGMVIDGHINRGGMGIYPWAFRQDKVMVFNDILHSWLSNRPNIEFRGPGIVFGNTIHLNEITNFHYRATQHGTVNWAHPRDQNVLQAREQIAQRPGILIGSPNLDEELPETIVTRHWNIIDRNLIQGGPIGIMISEGAHHTILNRNVIDVSGEAIVDEGTDTHLGRNFLEAEEIGEQEEAVVLTQLAKEGAVPPSEQNLAKGISATASFALKEDLAGRLTDGNLGTSIGGGAGPQFVQLDLGASHPVCSVRLWHWFRSPRNYFGVIIQLSEDPSFAKGVTTVFNSDRSNDAGQGEGKDPIYLESEEGLTLEFAPVTARYLRFWLNGNSGNMFNHWSQIEVFAAR